MLSTKRKSAEPATQPSLAHEAPGVVYTAIAAAPGLKLFRCEPYRANLTIQGCAGRWREAQTANASPVPGARRTISREFRDELIARYTHCRSCKLGSAHAGQPITHYSAAWYGRLICPRCGNGTTRMIGNRRCVSCYNRERELKAGRNARGNLPIELLQRPLVTVEILLEVDGEVRRIRDRETTGVPETVVQALRTTKGELMFSKVPTGAAPITAAEPASDARVLYALTDRRCLGCGGRILKEQAGARRCACCGTEGEGRPDAPDEWSPTREEGRVDNASATVRRGIDALRARLFATTALAAWGPSL